MVCGDKQVTIRINRQAAGLIEAGEQSGGDPSRCNLVDDAVELVRNK